MPQRARECLLKIRDALFYKPGARGKPKSYLFSSPIRKFDILVQKNKPAFWGILGSRRADFLKVVASEFCSEPPLSRSYTFTSEDSKHRNIQFIDFRDTSGLDRCHMAARYEAYSFKGQLEMADDVNSVRNFITGRNNYNHNKASTPQDDISDMLLATLNLTHLQHKWINTLSNGQMRRARIAKAMYDRPRILVINDPFLGLDLKATCLVSDALQKIALKLNISIVAGLRNSSELPSWVTNVAFVDQSGIAPVDEKKISDERESGVAFASRMPSFSLSPLDISNNLNLTAALIQFDKASVIYKGEAILKNFSWKIERGSKWRIMGENGSGKTTLISLITADHPQSWKSVLSIDGVVRRPGSGANYFDINNKIGISSPELHANVPFRMVPRNVVLNGLIRDVGNSNFSIQFKDAHLPPFSQYILQQFELEISHCDGISFGDLSISSQKLLLFIRAILKNPEILVLDEAFSGMDENLVVKCHSFIAKHMVTTTMLAIGHLDWEVPAHDFILKLEGGTKQSYTFFSTDRIV